MNLLKESDMNRFWCKSIRHQAALFVSVSLIATTGFIGCGGKKDSRVTTVNPNSRSLNPFRAQQTGVINQTQQNLQQNVVRQNQNRTGQQVPVRQQSTQNQQRQQTPQISAKAQEWIKQIDESRIADLNGDAWRSLKFMAMYPMNDKNDPNQKLHDQVIQPFLNLIKSEGVAVNSGLHVEGVGAEYFIEMVTDPCQEDILSSAQMGRACVNEYGLDINIPTAEELKMFYMDRGPMYDLELTSDDRVMDNATGETVQDAQVRLLHSHALAQIVALAALQKQDRKFLAWDRDLAIKVLNTTASYESTLRQLISEEPSQEDIDSSEGEDKQQKIAKRQEVEELIHGYFYRLAYEVYLTTKVLDASNKVYKDAKFPAEVSSPLADADILPSGDFPIRPYIGLGPQTADLIGQMISRNQQPSYNPLSSLVIKRLVTLAKRASNIRDFAKALEDNSGQLQRANEDIRSFLR